jgi:hypothetical protein
MVKEATNELKRRFHIRVEELWKRRDSLPGPTLKAQAEALKAEIQQYAPWDSCTVFCPMNPYWKYTDLTERIREIIVLGISRGGSSTMSAQRQAELQAGVKSGEAAAERFRGEASTAEKLATGIVLGPAGYLIYAATGAPVPGGGRLSPMTAETASHLPEELGLEMCSKLESFGVPKDLCNKCLKGKESLGWCIWGLTPWWLKLAGGTLVLGAGVFYLGPIIRVAGALASKVVGKKKRRKRQ